MNVAFMNKLVIPKSLSNHVVLLYYVNYTHDTEEVLVKKVYHRNQANNYIGMNNILEIIKTYITECFFMG